MAATRYSAKIAILCANHPVAFPGTGMAAVQIFTKTEKTEFQSGGIHDEKNHLMTDRNEEQLVKECIAGNRLYQEFFYRKYCRKLMGICFRYARNREEAEDYLQESFIRIYSKLYQYKASGSLEGWMKRIVINTILESLRKKSLMFKVTDIEEAMDEAGPDHLLDEVSIQELVGLIHQLSPGYRTVFNLYAIEGYSHKEIASQLGISEGTSKSQYSMARKVLREKIKRQSVERITQHENSERSI
jgi:RNA polymerase sigma factor (sigma-70 family)